MNPHYQTETEEGRLAILAELDRLEALDDPDPEAIEAVYAVLDEPPILFSLYARALRLRRAYRQRLRKSAGLARLTQ